MSLMSGERQVAPTIDGIRRDHVARYEWAAKMLMAERSVIDFGCGIGYGTSILAEGLLAIGYDIDAESIDYARNNYSVPNARFYEASDLGTWDGPLVIFEVIEHLVHPEFVLIDGASRLLASVPNEAVFPYASLNSKEFHKRHYTKAQFEELLTSCGWRVQGWYTQHGIDGPVAEVVPDDDGWTIIADCVR